MNNFRKIKTFEIVRNASIQNNLIQYIIRIKLDKNAAKKWQSYTKGIILNRIIMIMMNLNTVWIFCAKTMDELLNGLSISAKKELQSLFCMMG